MTPSYNSPPSSLRALRDRLTQAAKRDGVVFGRLPLGIDGFAQVHVLHPRDHRKHVVDGAPVDGTLTTSGHVLAGGIAVTARL